MNERKYRQAIRERDMDRCLVTGKPADDIHEIVHRSTCSKRNQVKNGIFTLENGCELSRNVHAEIGSPYVGKVMLRYLLHLKYGYPRPPEIPENWFMDTIVKYLMYVNAGWKRPDLKENI
jgi:hypothetical protein